MDPTGPSIHTSTTESYYHTCAAHTCTPHVHGMSTQSSDFQITAELYMREAVRPHTH